MEKAGAISELELQPQFRLYVNDKAVCRYIADFRYLDNELSDQARDFVYVVEDVKGVKTEAYRLKKKLMAACLGIEIKEI